MEQLMFRLDSSKVTLLLLRIVKPVKVTSPGVPAVPLCEPHDAARATRTARAGRPFRSPLPPDAAGGVSIRSHPPALAGTPTWNAVRP